jgi:cell wall assembly regulator SMI1
MSMQDLWKRLEAWRAKNAPNQPFLPRPPAKAIAAAEKTMKVSFPADFRASLLVHDGEADYDGDPARFHWMPGCNRLAPLASIVRQRKDEQQLKQDREADDREVLREGRFKNVLWHSKWIPIACA